MQPTMPMMAPYAYPPVMPAYQPPTYPPPVGQSNFPNPAPPAYSSAVNAGKATTDPGQSSADGKTTELASQVKADGSQKNPDSIFQKCVVRLMQTFFVTSDNTLLRELTTAFNFFDLQ
ncbi:conserved hypothetical protein [Trichinella spiralis]|uniref:hypothetical protein n=1 Tax=Trichinella spiralis TaxID=6334 RepID=UPI0001EFB523|nr:conserved hypothetical protein [Trichinella spiralis]